MSEDKKNEIIRKYVLLVDDEEGICQLFKFMFEEREHYLLETANNSIEAFRLLQKHKYDLLITDIRMPWMDGIDFLKTIQFMDMSKVIITGYPNDETRSLAKRLGVTEYIVKPFDKDDLLTRIDKLLGAK